MAVELWVRGCGGIWHRGWGFGMCEQICAERLERMKGDFAGGGYGDRGLNSGELVWADRLI